MVEQCPVKGLGNAGGYSPTARRGSILKVSIGTRGPRALIRPTLLPVPVSDSPRRLVRIPLVLLLVAVACLGLGALVDGWYARLLLDRERATVRASAADVARSIERELGRRVALLAGLRAFVESHAGEADRLDRDFPVFAEGLLTGLDGVRALQLVHNGRIVATWPVIGNEAVLGYDLYGHPNPRVAADVRRAVLSRELVITGPIAILQGGTGLLARLAVGPGAVPELVNVILDVPALLADAGLDAVSANASFTLRDGGGVRIAGAVDALDAPIITPVNVGDGAWQLLTVPERGWGAALQRERNLLRVSMALIGALLIGVAGLLSGRQARLVRAVNDRTLALRNANAELAREVEERRVAERTTRERGEELRVALNAGQMGVWGWDIPTGRIVWDADVGQLYGVGRAHPESYDAFLAMLEPDDRSVLHDAVQATLTRGAPFHVQHRVQLPDGRIRWLFATAELQLDAAGQPARLLGVIMDVTARVELEQQLRQAQKMEAVGTLAGGIAHDFNNLLTAILGFARLAQESLGRALGDARQPNAPSDATALRDTAHLVANDLDELIRAGDRAALLTSQLLAFSRQQVVRPTVLDVNAVVAELERLLARLLDERIALRLTLTPDPVFVRADAGQLSQVVLNLVVNARDAMSHGGHIVVSTHRHAIDAPDRPAVLGEGAWTEIRVVDDGAGIPEAIRERIFDPFFTTKATGKGTGLGLSTAYGIVTQAGGHIVVDSEEGRGTTMRVFLPCVVASADTRTPARGLPAVRGGRETILVVEDEPGVRRLVCDILQRAGHVVRSATDGVQALAVLDAEAALDPASRVAPVSLVVSDVVMPEMGGIELCAALRERRPGLPVLLMSGYPASQAGELAPDVPFLTKPFTPTDLLAEVRALLDAPRASEVAPTAPLRRSDSTS
jgi:two-component system, cell cycle sensor histidine kinase and response regulator CckA